MAITAEWIINKAKQKIYAVSHAKVVVRGDSTVDADMASLENRVETLENNTAGEDASSLLSQIGALNTRVSNLESILENMQGSGSGSGAQ